MPSPAFASSIKPPLGSKRLWLLFLLEKEDSRFLEKGSIFPRFRKKRSAQSLSKEPPPQIRRRSRGFAATRMEGRTTPVLRRLKKSLKKRFSPFKRQNHCSLL